MRFHDLEPRCDRTAFETVPGRNIGLGHVLETDQDRLFIHKPARQLVIAMFAGRQRQVERRHRRPELQVIHRFKPGFDIILASEITHLFEDIRLSNRRANLGDHDG